MIFQPARCVSDGNVGSVTYAGNFNRKLQWHELVTVLKP
jgi:hypothetical protein